MKGSKQKALTSQKSDFSHLTGIVNNSVVSNSVFRKTEQIVCYEALSLGSMQLRLPVISQQLWLLWYDAHSETDYCRDTKHGTA